MKKILKTIVISIVIVLMCALCISAYNTHKIKQQSDMTFEGSNGGTVYVTFGEVEYV